MIDWPELTLGRIRDAAGLAAVAEDWDRIVRAAPRPSPFLLHGWVTEWWRHYGSGATLAVLTVHRGERLVGLAPLFIRRSRGLRVCRFLGGHESALGDFLVDPATDDAVGRALIDGLRTLRFDYVDLFGMPDDGVLSREAPRVRLPLMRRVEAPVLLMPDGWDAAYAARTSSKKRNFHRRRLRQLTEVGEVSWTVARTPDEVATELEHAFAIHAERWKGRPDGSTFGTIAGRAFHRDGARALAAQDHVRIVTLRVAGKPVAFHYSFVIDTAMYVHRLAFGAELARFSPGQVTLLRAIEEASKEGATRVEFLGGDERYKLELADGIEPMHQAIGLARGPLAVVVVRGLVGMIEARKRLKRNPFLHRLYQERLGAFRRRADPGAASRSDGQAEG